MVGRCTLLCAEYRPHLTQARQNDTLAALQVVCLVNRTVARLVTGGCDMRALGMHVLFAFVRAGQDLEETSAEERRWWEKCQRTRGTAEPVREVDCERRHEEQARADRRQFLPGETHAQRRGRTCVWLCEADQMQCSACTAALLHWRHADDGCPL